MEKIIKETMYFESWNDYCEFMDFNGWFFEDIDISETTLFPVLVYLEYKSLDSYPGDYELIYSETIDE